MNVEKKWVPEIKQNSDGVPYIVVGNKIDLRNDPSLQNKIVSRHLGENIAKKVGAARYLECSAKTQENLKEVFDECIQVVYDVYSEKAKKAGKAKKGAKGEKCLLQ